MNLEKKTVPELKRLAKSRGFTGYSKLRKADLISLLSSSKCGSKKMVNPSSGRCVLPKKSTTKIAPIPFSDRRHGRGVKTSERKGTIRDDSAIKELDELEKIIDMRKYRAILMKPELSSDEDKFMSETTPYFFRRAELLFETNPEQLLSEFNMIINMFETRINKDKPYNVQGYKSYLDNRDELKERLGISKSPRDDKKEKSPRGRGLKFDDPSDCPLSLRARTKSKGGDIKEFCKHLETDAYKTTKGFWCCADPSQ